MIRRPPRSTLDRSSAASDVYKRQVQLFSLQKGKSATQLNTSGAGGFIVDLAAQCIHFGDTAAAIELMDLVVTTDCGVAHLAGCLGKPALNLLQYKPCWIYGMRGEATPSYPTMRLIRQASPGDWDSVFREMSRLVGTWACLLYTSPSPRDRTRSRMPSSA